MPSDDIRGEETAKNQQLLAYVFIGAYVLASLVYGFMSNAPWDDDCVTRYYHTKDALHDPSMFFSLWNRPLFVLLFFPVAQIGSWAMMLQMIAITAVGGYFLYKAVEKLGINYPSVVLPLFFFQTYFFSVSRNNLTEPLAAAIICLGLYFLTHRKYLWFAVVGSLLPLARLELSVLLAIWALILVMKGQWKYVLILGMPTLLVDLLGTFYKDGDVMWMVNETFGREDEDNRYGHTDFWSYFKRYIFVTGPVVFYFFFIGLVERIKRWKIDLFVFIQCVLGFMLYVVFSWKLNMGNAAGFLRNLLPLTPLVAVIALHGYNYWINTFKMVEEEQQVNEDHVNEPVQEVRHKKSKRSRMKEAQIKKQREERQAKLLKSAKLKRLWKSVWIHLFSIGLAAITYLYYTNAIEMHHKLTDDKDYTNLIVIGTLGVIGLLLVLMKKAVGNKSALVYVMAALVFIGSSSYTLITEPPDAHLSPERQALNDLVDTYKGSYLEEIEPVYANHLWFFWTSGLDYPSEKFKTLNKENLDKAPVHSLVLWENHYSHRIFGDVTLTEMEANKDFVELCRIISTDNKFTAILFQKVDSLDDKGLMVDRFIGHFPDLPYGYLTRAKARYDRKDYKGAIEDADKVLEIDSTIVHAYFSKGLVYFATKDFELAAASFSIVADSMPKYYQANYNAGISYTTGGKYKESIPYLKRAIEVNQGQWGAYEQLGLAYFSLERFSESLECFNTVVNGNPNSYMNYSNRGNALFKLGRYQEAIADYDRCIKLSPNYAGAYFNKGLAYSTLNKKPEACAAMFEAAKRGHAQAASIWNANCK